jgi:enoyl-CoA hydratase
MLQATDIRVAADDARFAIAEVKHSLFPMGGSTVRLARQISFCNAMELLLTGEQISADHALRIGLINKVVPRAQVMPEARRYAEIIRENGPIAVQAVKRSVMASLGVPTAQALEKELEIGIPASSSEDAREGARAFKEKRKPVFKGR